MEILPFCFVLVVFSIVISIVVWSFIKQRKTGEAWEKYAQSVGLFYTGREFDSESGLPKFWLIPLLCL